MSSFKPLVGICCDTKMDGPHRYHLAGHKYINAVAESAHAIPLLMPSLGSAMDWDAILSQLDGVLLTGSYSNIQPHLSGINAPDSGSFSDEYRDETVLPLIPKIIDTGVPLLAICRGFQEMNVTYGGSLHRMVHEVDGLDDHREDKTLSVSEQYAVSHPIDIHPDGILAKITHGKLRQMVNSIHMQGINTLGGGLRVEATAKDGLIEAFSVAEAPAYNLAVQWHPEWKTPDNPFYQQIFTSFADACRQRHKINNRHR